MTDGRRDEEEERDLILRGWPTLPCLAFPFVLCRVTGWLSFGVCAEGREKERGLMLPFEEIQIRGHDYRSTIMRQKEEKRLKWRREERKEGGGGGGRTLAINF